MIIDSFYRTIHKKWSSRDRFSVTSNLSFRVWLNSYPYSDWWWFCLCSFKLFWRCDGKLFNSNSSSVGPMYNVGVIICISAIYITTNASPFSVSHEKLLYTCLNLYIDIRNRIKNNIKGFIQMGMVLSYRLGTVLMVKPSFSKLFLFCSWDKTKIHYGISTFAAKRDPVVRHHKLTLSFRWLFQTILPNFFSQPLMQQKLDVS